MTLDPELKALLKEQFLQAKPTLSNGGGAIGGTSYRGGGGGGFSYGGGRISVRFPDRDMSYTPGDLSFQAEAPVLNYRHQQAKQSLDRFPNTESNIMTYM